MLGRTDNTMGARERGDTCLIGVDELAGAFVHGRYSLDDARVSDHLRARIQVEDQFLR